MFQEDNKRHSRVQDHTHKQKTNKNIPHAPSLLAMHPRETYKTRTPNINLIIVNTQRKDHDISQALSVVFKNLSGLTDTEF